MSTSVSLVKILEKIVSGDRALTRNSIEHVALWFSKTPALTYLEINQSLSEIAIPKLFFELKKTEFQQKL